MSDLLTLIESISLFRLFAWGVMFPIVVFVLWFVLQVIRVTLWAINYAARGGKVEAFWD